MAKMFTNPQLFDPRQQERVKLFDPFVMKRAALLPMVRTAQGREFGAPQFAVDMWNSLTLPGAVAKEYVPGQAEAAQMAMDTMLGGGLMSAPSGAVASGAVRR